MNRDTTRHGALANVLLRALFCAAMLAAGAARADDGSVTFQMNAAHDGRIVFSAGFTPPLKQKWVKELKTPLSFPIVANGLVFITGRGNKNSLYAVDLKTGRLAWEKAIDKGYTLYHAYDNGRIFVLSWNGLLQAYTADRDGTLLWSVALSPPSTFHFWSPPVATQGRIIIDGEGSDGAPVFAVDEVNGAILWQATAIGGGGGGAPCVADGGVFVAHPYQNYKFDFVTGATLWHNDWGGFGGGNYTPVYAKKEIYQRDFGASGQMMLKSASGAVDGSFGGLQPPAFWTNTHGNVVEIVLDDYQYFAVDPKSGNALWTFKGDGLLTTAPIVINDVVVAGSLGGNLYLLDAKTGQLLWQTTTLPMFSPDEHNAGAVSGLGAGAGMLVIPSGSKLVAFEQVSAN